MGPVFEEERLLLLLARMCEQSLRAGASRRDPG
jgi:hypothetical protein